MFCLTKFSYQNFPISISKNLPASSQYCVQLGQVKDWKILHSDFFINWACIWDGDEALNVLSRTATATGDNSLLHNAFIQFIFKDVSYHHRLLPSANEQVSYHKMATMTSPLSFWSYTHKKMQKNTCSRT